MKEKESKEIDLCEKKGIVIKPIEGADNIFIITTEHIPGASHDRPTLYAEDIALGLNKIQKEKGSIKNTVFVPDNNYGLHPEVVVVVELRSPKP
jgi:hypothetical protein